MSFSCKDEKHRKSLIASEKIHIKAAGTIQEGRIGNFGLFNLLGNEVRFKLIAEAKYKIGKGCEVPFEIIC